MADSGESLRCGSMDQHARTRAATARTLASRELPRRLEAGMPGAFGERALRNRRLAWGLLAEPVDPLADAEPLAFREA